jgi:hypothetical protein
MCTTSKATTFTTSHLNGKVERSHHVDEQEFSQLMDKDGIADDFASGRTILIVIDRTEPLTGRRLTNGSW